MKSKVSRKPAEPRSLCADLYPNDGPPKSRRKEAGVPWEGPFGKVIGLMISAVPYGLQIFWPYLERGRGRHPRRRKWAMWLGYLAVLTVLIFALLGHFSENNIHLFGTEYHIDMYGVPHALTEAAP